METIDTVSGLRSPAKVTGGALHVIVDSGGGGGGGSGSDREMVVTTYVAKNAFTGASVGDTITATQILDVTSTPSTVSTIWRNQTTAADLAGAPSAANLTLVGTGGATETTLSAQSTLMGATNETAPASDTATSGQNGRLQRIAQRLTTLIDAIPVSLGIKTSAGSLSVTLSSDHAAIPNTPTVGAAFGASVVSSPAQEASRVIKNSAGTLMSLVGYNAKTTAQFIQVHNTTAVPNDGQVPVYSFVVPATSSFELPLPSCGAPFTSGISVCNSSTQPTKTIGSADCWFTAVIK